MHSQQQIPYAGEIDDAMRRAEAAASNSGLSKADRLDAQHVHDLLGKLKVWGESVCAQDAAPRTRLPGARMTGEQARVEKPQKRKARSSGRPSVAKVRERLMVTQARLSLVQALKPNSNEDLYVAVVACLKDEEAWLRLQLGEDA